ncbi:hypothetical protein PHISP_03159 [Aspergillus sp. HF37]|nr:hypothetical protein PHISP_03159 [Aspergillus sp. HF37]
MTLSTSTPNPIAFIIGSGPRIGRSVAKKLTSEGYMVALGSRNPDTAQSDFVPISVDFRLCAREAPGVVVYNAAALSFPSDPSDPVGSIAPEDLERDFSVNALGAYATLRESVEGFRALKRDGVDAGVFVATGNVTPFQPLPMAFTLGTGKAALVHMIQIAFQAHKDHGFR